MPHAQSSPFNRREVLTMLGAGALAARRAIAAPEPAVRFTALDHVAIAVSDVDKSVAFYTRVFGNNVLKNKETVRRYVKLGPCYVAIAPPGQGQENHRVDHICPGVEGFDAANVKSSLEQRGVRFRDSNLGPFVTDPDGLQVQLWKFDSWSETVRTALPESHPIAGEPIFRPTGMDHILLDVTDPEKSSAFYEKIFGPVTQRNNNRTWFQVGKSRIGLLAVANGKRPGVNHFCVSATAFEYAAAMKKLAAAGATLVSPEAADAPQFRDPDGILVQVMGPRNAAGKKA
jgi:catechol 2,3-dioxygenase-like lactoylglutathione lyase family enzyme